MSGPLAGIKVLSLARVLSGPFCSMLLKNLGAEVIKVEREETGDDTRQFPPFVDGDSAYFATLNNGQKSIVLNLKSKEDREILEKLFSKVDVILENFRPGVMERLGYNWEYFKKNHPQAIFASISGFGQHGPYKLFPAYDLIAQSMGGTMSITGTSKGLPTRIGTPIADIYAGLHTALGIVTALYQKQHTHQGQRIDISMLDCQVALLNLTVTRYSHSKQNPYPNGNRHPGLAPVDIYQTGDRKVAISALTEEQFKHFCNTISLPNLINDKRFSSALLRFKNAEALTQLIEEKTKQLNSEDIIRALDAAGVSSSHVDTIEDLLKHPQLSALNMIASFAEGPMKDKIKFPGNPIHFSNFPNPTLRPPGPRLDGYREEVLSWLKPEKK